MNITFFGTGYVGLVQATVLADAGHKVCCVDIDQEKIEKLGKGDIPIYEPGLSELVKENLADGRIFFTTDAKSAVEFANVIYIAVGTPPDEDGSADLKYVINVAETIAEYMLDSKIVVNKSTVPVGTVDLVTNTIEKRLNEYCKTDISVAVVSNPEFLKEGAAIQDCQKPDRIVIGTVDPVAEKVMRDVYAPFNRNHDKIIVMDPRSSEMTKYVANCMLATKISFMNEMANIAEKVGADIENIRQGIGSDERIGYHFIYPGCGYGGSCFPKDVNALVNIAEKVDYDSRILKAVEDVNSRQKKKLAQYIEKHFANSLEGKTFALWGLAFKPNTDDMREASSRQLLADLWEKGAKIKAYDPEASNEAIRIYGDRTDLMIVESMEETLKGADALVICTEWSHFRAPDFELIIKELKNAVIFDGRNMFNPDSLADMGVSYYAIGRGLSIIEHGVVEK